MIVAGLRASSHPAPSYAPRAGAAENGQTAIEFALICLVLMTLSVGLVDAGRAFYQYNAISAAARYGARWGSVMGGSCALPISAGSTSDWCNQIGGSSSNFWNQSGNKPLQGVGSSCPSYSSTPADYYQASTYNTTSSTTIVGAVAHKLDTNNSSYNLFNGAVSPGIDLTKLEVCISLSGSNAIPAPGTSLEVDVYYPFTGVSKLVAKGTLYLNATSEYQVE